MRQLIAIAMAGLGLAQTKIDLKTQARNADFSAFSSTRPLKTGTALPATCAVGDMYFVSNATAGQNIYGCTATNTWTAQAGGGGGSASWGSIGGTLSGQSDLQAALDAKQNAITTGTSAQYLRGNLTLGTFAHASTHASAGSDPVSLSVDQVSGAEASANKNASNGYAGLSSGKVGASQLQEVLALADLSDVTAKGGNSTTVQMRGDGSPSANDCAKFDADGNIVSSGGACAAGGASHYQTVEDEGSPLTQRATLNFAGAGVVCADSGGTKTTCTIAGGAGSYSAGSGIDASQLAGNVIALDTATVPTYLTGSASIDFSSIANASCASSTFALSGAATGDALAPRWPNTLESGLLGTMVVSSANTVQVRLCNLSGAPVDPANQNYGATVVKAF